MSRSVEKADAINLLEYLSMNELIILLALGFFSYLFFPKVLSKSAQSQSNPAELSPKLFIPQDSTLRRHFLTQLRADIENDLMPAKVEPDVREYYEASVAAEFQKRLVGTGL
jgi:hypothetical protein